MNRGYLIHAYNNWEIDYGEMALCACLLIKKHLRINATAIATSHDTLDCLVKKHGPNLIAQAFDHIIINSTPRDSNDRTFHDTRYSHKTATYHNSNRADSFKLSPFDETMLIDADYLVLDNSFDTVWGSPDEIMVNKLVVDLHHKEDLGGFNKRLNVASIPLYWATAMYFQKTMYVKSVFDLISVIKENYQFYQNLYKFPLSGYFRNDYALSIALHMLNGQIEHDTVRSLPINKLMVATEYDDLVNFINGTAYCISEAQQGDFKLHKIDTNIHIMNKWAIGRMAPRIINYAAV